MTAIKTAEDYKREAEIRNRKDAAELEKLAPKLPVPDGFNTEWRDNYLGWGTRVFVMFKPKDTEFIFKPGGSGTTNFETSKGLRTFDRRGVEDSFYWKGYSFGRKKPPVVDVKAVLDEQIKRIADRREFFNSAITVPGLGHSVSPDALAKYKAELKKPNGHVTFTPAGFGTGYNVVRKSTRKFGVRRAGQDLEKFFECSPLWIESFDCD